jgi:hypothetical protein
MPYPSTNTNTSEIKLFYQIYGEKNSKPHDVILFNTETDQKFGQDVIDDLVGKGLWDENLEKQLENKQLYFKVFREDEDMIPADAVMFENVRLLPNQGLLSLEESLQNTVNWFGSFIPERVKQTAFSLGNSLAQWTEDKLSGFSAYSGIPTVEEMDKEVWHEIVDENSDESEIAGRIKQSGSDKTIEKDVGSVATLLDPTYEKIKGDEKSETDSTSKSLAESLLNITWNFAHYAYNNPLKTLTFALAAFSATNNFQLPKVKFENQSLKLTNGINTATDILIKFAVAKIATNGMHSGSTLNRVIAGMSMWNPVVATTSEFRVNSYTTNDQAAPKVAILADGNFIVVWEGEGSAGTYSIYAQRFNGTNGGKLGTEFTVSTSTTYVYHTPSLTGLSNGNFVVAWDAYQRDTASTSGIYGQRFNLTGSILGSDFLVNSYVTGEQTNPSITSLPNGNFVVAWMSGDFSVSQDGSDAGVYGKRFNGATGAPLGSEFKANTYTINEQGYPSIASLTDGNFVITWQSSDQPSDGFGYGIYAQRFNGGTSAKIGTEFLVNTYTTSDQKYPSIAGLLNGNFVIVWQGERQGDNQGISARCFNSTAALGAEFPINTFTTGIQSRPSVVGLSDGNFVVVWESNSTDGSGYGIYGQRANATGTLGSQFLVNSFTTNDQRYPSIASLFNGTFVVTWQSNLQDGSGLGIFARIIGPAPVLGNNTLFVNEGRIQLITPSALSASALNTPAGTLIFTVSNVTHGRFEFLSSPNIPIFNFTQQQVTDSQIQFVHDGSKIKPSYNVKVSEAVLDTNPTPATIIFNTAPILTGSATILNFTEKSAASFIDTNITLSDVDSFNILSAKVWVSSNFAGTEDIIGFVNQSGIVGIYNSSAGVLSLTGTSSLANYQTALRTVSYLDTSNNPSLSPRMISFVVDDGALSNIIIRIINITPINDAPVLSNIGGSFTFTEKSAALFIDTSVTLNDVDNLNMMNATVWISNGFAGIEDVLGFVNQAGIVGIYNPSSGVLSLTSSSSIASYQTALRSVTYSDTSNYPSLLQRTISFIVNDGGLNSNIITRMVNIIPVNDPPVLIGIGGLVTFTEKNPAITIDSALLITDDNLNLTNATVKFISGVLSEDVLSFVAQGGISGAYSNSTGTLFLTGNSSVSNYQLVLRGVTYFNPSLNPSTLLRTVSFVVHDGQFASNIVNRSITVTPVNDPPELIHKTLIITAGQSVNLTATELLATDPDNPDSSLTFTMSAIQFCRFERTNAAGIGITTFTQPDINNNQIRIVATGGVSSAPAYQISVSDGQLSTSPVPASVTFNGASAPNISPNQLTISQGGNVILTTTQLNANDADTPPSSLIFTVSNIDHGIFSDVRSPTVPITSFSLQLVIDGFIQFTHDGSEIAPSYEIAVTDGLYNTNKASAGITFINVNDAPILTIGTSGTLSFTENTPVVIDPGIGVNDADNPALLSATVRFTSTLLSEDVLSFTAQGGISGAYSSSSGILALTGSSSLANYQSALRSVMYSNPSDNPSTILRTVSFIVSDGQLNSNTIVRSINIIPVNDLPKIIVNTMNITSCGQTLILSSKQLQATDPDDSSDNVLTFTVLPQNCHFENIKNTGVSITHFTQQNINDGEIKFFTPTSGTLSYKVSVSDGKDVTAAKDADISFVGCNQVSNKPPTNITDTALDKFVGGIVSGLVGLAFFAIKYRISYLTNKKLQKALEASQTDLENKQQDYDNKVIKPIGTVITDHLKITAPFEKISTKKVKSFMSSVHAIVSEMNILGIQYQYLNEAERQIVHSTIIRELKEAANPNDSNCCSYLLRCGFFKPDIEPQLIEQNAKAVAITINRALNRSKLNASVRSSDSSTNTSVSKEVIELTRIVDPVKSELSTTEQPPRVSSILPKLAEERAARVQLETEMAEMKRKMDLLLNAKSTEPVTIPEPQQPSRPSLSM